MARDSGIGRDDGGVGGGADKMMGKCGCGHAESPEDNDSTWYIENQLTEYTSSNKFNFPFFVIGLI